MNPGSIIVVGAGVFGATAALEFRRRGYAVTLCDPGPLPNPRAASTDVSKFIRMDYGADEFYMNLVERALEGWDAWNREWPRSLYHQDGIFVLTRDQMHAGSFEYESFVRLQKRGHAPQRLNAETLRARFPALKGTFGDGYFNPRAGWAESGNVLAWLIRQAQAAGVSLREGATMARLMEEGSKVVGVETADGTVHRADFVVVAAGVWTPVLLPEMRDLMWATGQPVLHFHCADPATYQPPGSRCPWLFDVANTGWYGYPALADGTVKVANHGRGRRIDADDSRQIDRAFEERCRDFLRTTLPVLADAPLMSSRLCAYTDTWDGDFYIDHHPDRPGVVVASGGSGHGFKYAPILGQITADVLEGKRDPNMSRFAWRPLGTPRKEAARAD